MGAAADDLLKRFDKHARRMDSDAKADEEKDRRHREHAGRDARTSLQRLGNMLRGEKPTRESNEEYRNRKGSK